jgi:hypothetical protein
LGVRRRQNHESPHDDGLDYGLSLLRLLSDLAAVSSGVCLVPFGFLAPLYLLPNYIPSGLVLVCLDYWIRVLVPTKLV